MSEETKTTKKRKPKANKPKISFTAQPSVDNIAPTSEAMTEHMRRTMNQQAAQLEVLSKSVEAVTIRKDSKGYDKSKVVFSSRENNANYNGVESKSYRRLSDVELKELAQVDPYVSAIISTRVSQSTVIGRPSDSKFDKGTRIYEMDPIKEEDFDNKDEFNRDRARRQAQMKTILKWVMNCGTTDEELINTAFAGADNTFKKCSFAEFLSAQTRNLLTFGRCATQIFRNPDGIPIMFRPAPVEVIRHVATGEDITLSITKEGQEQSIEDANEYNALEEDERPAAFVMQVDGQNIRAFTERDMQVWHFQKQALFDLDGYPLAPLEQAIFMVFTHQQTLTYLRNSYVKGLSAKGILNLRATDASGQLSEEDLDQLRREFHNFANRNDNSATTPVISGPVEVSWIPLMSNPRDMEFLQTEEHIIRALCSALLISPEEMGYGNLSTGQGGLTSNNKQDQISHGEERGLRMLLDIVYDGVNAIICENFPEFEELYRVTYVGVGEDSKDGVVQRQVTELNTTATLSSLYADSEKTDPVPFGGNVPLAGAFHSSVARYMKFGEMREYFFGEENASKNPAYDFLIDPGLNQSYQLLKVTPIEAQQEQAQLQLQSQEQQMQQAQQQAQQPQGQPGQEAPQSGEPQGDAQEQPMEPEQKSLGDAFRERNILAKSMGSYFSEWISAHNEKLN